MTVYAITDTKKGRTGIAPTYLHTTLIFFLWTLEITNIRYTVSSPINFSSSFYIIR